MISVKEAVKQASRSFQPWMKMKTGLALYLALCGAACSPAQQAAAPRAAAIPFATPQDETATIRTRASLVLVPALVTTKNSEPVFTLTADDFIVTDDGIPQVLRLEDDSDRQPLALVILIEAGGSGETHLQDYERLGTLIEAMIGDVEHTVAVVGFDSEAALVQPFTSRMVTVDEAIRGIGPGDGKAAILDGLSFSIDLLKQQPPRYRRAVVMLTETHDHGSHIGIPQAMRAVGDNNTAIYSFAYSSTRSDAKEEANGFSSTEPGPEHGCFSREWGGDPSRQPSVANQDFECLAELAPPLRLARIAFIAATGALRKNVPETVAKLTGGEYYAFSNGQTLEKGLQTLTKHVPNRYVLSFTPKSPHVGLHAVGVELKNHVDLKVSARSSYWAAGAP